MTLEFDHAVREALAPRTDVVPSPDEQASRVVIFVENRNGVRIAAALHDALATDAAVTLVTADVHADVHRWVTDEAALHPQLSGIRNLAHDWGVLRHDDVRPALVEHLPGFLAEHSIDRIVVFNDQSVRGSAVVDAAGNVPVVLIQDGTLEFTTRVITAGLGDQNSRYGTSAISRACVWGTAGRDRLTAARGDLPPVDIRVTGSVLHSAQDDLALAYEHRGRIQRRGTPRDRISVVLLDQPLAQQRKTSTAAHWAMLTDLVTAVTRLGSLTIKPHPSSNDAHLAYLRSLPGVTVMDSAESLTAPTLRSFDVAVTWFSTAYLDTMRAGVPLIAVGDPRVELALPVVKSELLRSVGSVEEAEEVLVEFAEVGHFRANASGVVPDRLLRLNADVVRDVAAAVTDPIHASAPVPKLIPAANLPRSARRDAALMALQAPAAPRVKIAVLGERFIQSVGVSLPVMAFARHMAATGDAEVRLIDVMEFHSLDAMTAQIAPDEVVIINSLRPFWVKSWMPDLVAHLRARGRTPFVYAHETRAVVEREHAAYRARHEQMLPALADSVVLCVSAAQATMFHEMGVKATRVVYNTSPGVVPAPLEPRPAGERPTIVMVGTVQARKGAGWFSRTADLAAERQLPWDFVWIGGGTADIYRSEHVRWTGHLPRRLAHQAVQDADVFLLSSVDDPMPLSALEAVTAGVRVVAYQGVGSHEVLDGVRGYTPFDRHDPELMLDAVQRALDDQIDVDEFHAVVDTFSVDAFAERLLAVIAADAAAGAAVRDSRAPSSGGTIGMREVTRALRAERFDEARVFTRQVLRNSPTRESLVALSRAWLAAGERDVALALLRTAHVMASDDAEFAAVMTATFADVGISMRDVDRWTLRKSVMRGWRRVRPRLDGSRS